MRTSERLFDLLRMLVSQRQGRWANTPTGAPMHWRNSRQFRYSLMSFKEAIVSNAKKIRLTSLLILNFTCGTIIIHLSKELSSQFHLKLENYSGATQATLSLGEAFQEFHTEIAYILAMMLILLLALLISCPRPLVGLVIMVISFVGLFLYIPDLVGSAHETVVTCGLLGLPLIYFTTLAALVLSLIFVCLAVFFAYLIYRCARSTGRSTGGELEVDMEDIQDDVEEGGEFLCEFA